MVKLMPWYSHIFTVITNSKFSVTPKFIINLVPVVIGTQKLEQKIAEHHYIIKKFHYKTKKSLEDKLLFFLWSHIVFQLIFVLSFVQTSLFNPVINWRQINSTCFEWSKSFWEHNNYKNKNKKGFPKIEWYSSVNFHLLGTSKK